MSIGRNPGVEAGYYDSEYTFTEDRDFYLDLIGAEKRRIVGLGCGTGRLLIPLARAGHTVFGIDNSAFMLQKLEHKYKTLTPGVKKRITYAAGDMLEFGTKGRFDIALLAFNLFFMVETRSGQREVLRRVHKHLKAEGRVILTTINPAQDWFREKIREMKFYGTWTREESGIPYDRFYGNVLDKKQQHMDFHLFYDTVRGDGTVRRERNVIRLSYLYSFELQHMLEAAGFTVTRIFGGYSGEPFTPDSKLMIFEARKPGARRRNKKSIK